MTLGRLVCSVKTIKTPIHSPWEHKGIPKALLMLVLETYRERQNRKSSSNFASQNKACRSHTHPGKGTPFRKR